MATEVPWQQGKFTLSGSLTSVATTFAFALASGSQSPPSLSAGQQTTVVVDNETIQYTGITGSGPYTVTGATRGTDGSTAATHSSGATGYGVVTQSSLNSLVKTAIQALTSISFAADTTVATAAGALTVDSFAALNLGTSTATSVSIGAAAVTTTVNGPLALSNEAVTWGVGVSAPTISQPTQASDAACSSITITPQAPFASAATNVVGGSIVAQLSAPISGSTEAALVVKRGNTTICQIQTYPGLSNYGAIFLQPGVSIAANSETLAASSSTVILNHGTQVVLGIAGATILACNATTIIHAVASVSWNATVVAPSITQTAPTAVSSGNGTAGTSFSIAGQTGGATSANSATGGAGSTLSITSPGGGNATGTSATGGAAGALVLGTGVPGTGTSAAGAKAPINFQIAGTTYMAISAAGLVTYTNAVTATTATTGTATLPGLVAIFVEESVNGMTYKRALYNV